MHELLKSNIVKWFKNGRRYDGRGLDEFRPVTIEYGVTKNAEGSARVKIGNTEVIAGVKLSVEKPYPDTHDSGNLMVGAELLPLSSPDFEAGPPNEESIEIARVVDRGLRESKAIDIKKLCLIEGEKVWSVSIDVCAINSDGNLLDAAALAALAAINDARFPGYDGKAVDYKRLTDKRLPILRVPVSITVHKIGEFIFVDPSVDEEKVIDARLTVAMTPDGRICAMQKGGASPLSIEDVGRMIDLAAAKAQEIRAKIRS